MNKNCYRIIFNRQKGQLMVVSELANRNGCVTTASPTPQTTSQRIIAKLKPLCLMVGMALGSVAIVEPAMAEIVADNTAAEHQQPQIIQGANRPEIVNIQAADASGLSHNKYTQFDVDKQGAILNNSLQDSNTKLGGDISGNANLINGEAKIILNEVNSQNPSKLNGFIEVAGQKAQVIIANPSGIACDGCGFINADKATLTTGKPQIEEGQLKGYKVTDGKISITGKGLNTTKQDYTEIIARSVEVNANLRGNDIKIVTGRNDVSADLNTITAIDDNNESDNKPRLALDVSALGGMYAGKIHLVGTEKGVGVNNAGRLTASKDGIVLKANGKIVNTGSIQAQDDIFLKSTDNIENNKQIYSKKNIKLLSQQKIINEGSLFAQQGDIKARGKDVVLHGKNIASQRIKVKANHVADLSNSDIKANALNVYSSNNIDINSATLNVDENINLKSEKSINSNNVVANTTKNYIAQSAIIDNKGSTITAGNNIELTASDTLNNELSSLQAGSTVNLTGNAINSDQASLEAGDSILVTSILLSAKDATLISDNNINIDNAEKFDAENIRIDATGEVNIVSKGNVNAKNAYITNNKLGIQADQLELTNARIDTIDSINVDAAVINNAGATWHSKGKTTVHGDDINNTKAEISAADLELVADHIDNVEAKLASLEGSMTISSNQVDNSKATLTSAGNMTIRINHSDEIGTGTQINNSEATLNSKGSMFIESRELNNTKAEISATNMTLSSFILNNQEAKLTKLRNDIDSNSSMVLIGEHQIDNSGATLISDNIILMGGDNINNTKVNIQAGDEFRIRENKTLHNHEAVITADRIDIETEEFIDNQQATLTGNRIFIDTNKLDNILSNITADLEVVITADNFKNDRSSIKSDDDLSISGTNLENLNSAILAKHHLDISSSEKMTNADSTIAGDTISIYGNELINDGKLLGDYIISINVSNKLDNLKDILANGKLSIETKQISNEGLLASGEELVLKSDVIGNAATGNIDSKDVIIEGGSLINDGLINGDDVNITLSGQFNNNDSARLYGDKINIIADELNNKASSLDVENAPIIAARNYLGIDVNTLNNYNHALLFSQGNMFIKAGTLNNHSARIESHGDMDIIAGTLNNVNDKVVIDEVQVEDKYVTEFAPLNSTQRYNAEEVEVDVNSELKHWNLILKSKTGAFKDADRFNEYNYDLTSYKSQITSTAPAEIVAGNNLFVNASKVNNVKSSIISGNEMNIAKEVLNNVSSQGTLREESNGTVTYHFPISKGLGEIVESGSSESSFEEVNESNFDFHNAIVEGHTDVVKTEVAFVPHKIN